MSNLNVVMIDSTIGTDYSLRLCSGLLLSGVYPSLITPQNRSVEFPIDFKILPWMPTKDQKGSKFIKIFNYVKYLVKIFVFITALDKKNTAVHFQFFRIEKIEALMFPLLRLVGVNLVFTAHNIIPHENSRLDYIIRNIIYQSAKVIIVHSQYAQKKLLNLFPIESQKVIIIPHGNFDHYLPATNIDKSTARNELGLLNKDTVLLFFGFIRKYKGLDLLLEAFEICKNHENNLKLLIAGSPHPQELKEYYEKKISQNSFNDNIFYHPKFIPFEKVAPYFLSADLVILPYLRIDNSGIIHLAYSFGLPIISTDVGSFTEVIENEKSGFILKSNTAECLAETILKASANKQRLIRMGAYAKRLSQEKYSWQNIAKITKNIYEELINN